MTPHAPRFSILLLLLVVLGCSGAGPTAPGGDGVAQATGAGTVLLNASPGRFLADITLDGTSILTRGYFYGGTTPNAQRTFTVVPSPGAAVEAEWRVLGDSGDASSSTSSGLTFNWIAQASEGESRVELRLNTPDGELRRLFRFNVAANPPPHRYPIPAPIAEVELRDRRPASPHFARYNVAQDELVLQWVPDADPADIRAALIALDLQILYAYEHRPAYLLYHATGGDLWTVIEQLRALPWVRFAEPNVLRYLAEITPNDPSYGEQFCLPLQQADEAWEIGKGSATQIIAIMDTGTGRQHPDLAAKVVDGADFVTPAGDGLGGEVLGDGNGPDRNVGHGVHCSGIAAAITDNATGGAGMSWNTKLMGLRVFPTSGDGPTTLAIVVAAHDHIRFYNQNPGNTEKIVACNMSFAGGPPSALEQDAITLADATGITYAAAAGNDSFDWDVYPANYDHVISVASLDRDDVKSDFSNFGTWVDVSASGSDIWNTYYKGPPGTPDPNTYDVLSGTSMAAPQVAGLIALIRGLYPSLSPDAVAAQILRTADNVDAQNPGFIGKLGSGRINAYQALLSGLVPELLIGDTVTFDDSHVGIAQGNRDRILNPGEKVQLGFDITNLGLLAAADFRAEITNPDDPHLKFLSTGFDIVNITWDGGIEIDGAIILSALPTTPDNYAKSFNFSITDPTGTYGPWTSTVDVVVERDARVADAVTGVATDLTGGSILKPQPTQPFFSVDLPVTTNYLSLKSLRVSLFGTVPASSVRNVRLWQDDGDGAFDGVNDRQLGLTSYWNASYQSNFDRQSDPAAGLGAPQDRSTYRGATITGSVLFDGLQLGIPAGTTPKLFVSADVLVTAPTGATIGLGVLSASDVVLPELDTALGLPWSSAAATISNAWSVDAPFVNSSGRDLHARAAVGSDGHIYVAYDGDPFGDLDIMMKESFDGGDTWEEEYLLTFASSHQASPDVAVDANNVAHVVYDTDAHGPQENYYLNSTDPEWTWTEGRRITTLPGDAHNPRIVAIGTTLYMVWFEDAVTPDRFDIYWTTSTDTGASWSAPQRVSNSPANTSASWPSIVNSGGTLYCTWLQQDGSYRDGLVNPLIMYSYKPPAGAWATPQAVAGPGGLTHGPEIALATGSRAYIAFHAQNPPNDWDVWLVTLNGASASSPVQVTTMPGETTYPMPVGSASGRLDVVFQQETAPDVFNTFHMYRASEAGSWSTPTQLSHNAVNLAHQSFLLREPSTGNMWTFWEDGRAGTWHTWFSRWIE